MISARCILDSDGTGWCRQVLPKNTGGKAKSKETPSKAHGCYIIAVMITISMIQTCFIMNKN